MDYSRVFGSNFPNKSINVGTRKDVDDIIISVVNKYNAHLQAGDMTGASAFYQLNKDILEPYIINMDYINRLEEEIYNTGLYALNYAGDITAWEEPTEEQNSGNYWLQDY